MKLLGFFSEPVAAPATRNFQVDFGDDLVGRLSPAPWNNYDDGSVGFTAGTSLSNLTDTNSVASTIEVAITASFSNVNGAGSADDAGNPFVYEATRDSFEITNGSTATLEFRNLDPTKVYDLLIFGARAFIGDMTDYTATGANSDTGSIDVRNNGNGEPFRTVTLSNIVPNGSNIIVLDVAGNGGNGYLNVVELIEKTP